ncbi:CTP synthetase [Aliiroseovarius sp. F47248L]|uniref:CTP synthetase n=1 Tax=Aliiroseovarius sp. F47248L TaxID=2926420 RepID=UPI001FF52CC2|nr:CTP synthetase [Aliiroseovarius sp. F47248L]MCK0139644.1 CTP synthetase [Aliiroseovarius sp. F47248L]
MFRLAAVIYILLGATLAGIFIIAALTVGMDTAQPIIYAAIAGFVVALPVSWVVAKQIKG